MILVTGKETGLPAYLWIHEIESVEKHGGASPYTRIWLKNDKMHHRYYLDVIEDEIEIGRRIREERLAPGCEKEGGSV